MRGQRGLAVLLAVLLFCFSTLFELVLSPRFTAISDEYCRIHLDWSKVRPVTAECDDVFVETNTDEARKSEYKAWLSQEDLSARFSTENTAFTPRNATIQSILPQGYLLDYKYVYLRAGESFRVKVHAYPQHYSVDVGLSPDSDPFVFRYVRMSQSDGCIHCFTAAKSDHYMIRIRSPEFR